MEIRQTYHAFLSLLSEKLVFLPDKPNENPRYTLDTLWYFSWGVHPTSRETNGDSGDFHLPELTPKAFHLLEELIEQRIGGIPLAHLIGVQVFMEIGFMVDASALIPRKETEILGYAALEKLRPIASERSEVKIMDVCTGMGNLAMALAIREPKATILAGDISAQAIALARKNARHLSLETRVQFFTGDMFEPFYREELTGTIDVITCNPPYISNGKLETMPGEIIGLEPVEAFDGGSFGLTIIFRLIRDSLVYLRDGGWLCFEVGLGQGDALAAMMRRNPAFQKIESPRDKDGHVRAILAQVRK